MSTVDRYRRLMHHLHRVALLNERVADRELNAVAGIGRTQFLVLRTVADSPELACSQQRLADHLGLTKAAVSRHVLRAERAGWLATEAGRSRREHTLRVTPRGRDLLASGRRVQDAAERRAARQLSSDELDQCIATLAALAERLELRLAEPPRPTPPPR